MVFCTVATQTPIYKEQGCTYSLFWFACDGKADYGGGVGLTQDESGLIISQGSFQAMEDEAAEKSEADKIVSLLLNCLTWTGQNETKSVEPINTKGFGKSSSAKKTRVRTPLFIGAGYESAVTKALANSKTKGSGTSPRPHWRRGHWRRVAVGEGRKERAWRLIKPTLVNMGS